MESYTLITEWLENYPHLYTLIGLSLLILISWVANWLVKRILVRGVYRILKNSELGRYSSLADSSFIRRMANIVPALILSAGIVIIPNISPVAVAVVQNVTTAFIVLTIALGIGSLLTIVNEAYNKRPDAHLKPIKGYIQVL